MPKVLIVPSLVLAVGLGLSMAKVHGQESTPCKPLLGGWGGRQTTCYGPSSADLVERQHPIRPVNSVASIEETTGLRLREIQIRTAAGIESGPPNEIVYVFGSLPDGGIPFPAPGKPEFVIVSESLAPDLAPEQPILDRGHGTTSRPGSVPREYYGPWQFHAGLRQRTVLLTVTSNLSHDVVQRIGEQMVSADRG